MNITTDEISVRGKAVRVPSICIKNRPVIYQGKWMKVAVVKDEEYLEGEIVPEPSVFIRALEEAPLRPDIFQFSQKMHDGTPRFDYYFEWDNAAATPITTYTEWFEKRVEYDVRKGIRKAAKLGLEVRAVPFSDELVRGIQEIYNESPVRQGSYFWHYRKDFETVKRENSTYLDRSEFIGAFYQGELVGFIRMVYAGSIASTLQVLSKNQHFDKKPTNALLAKAVEICEAKGMSWLVYGKYHYGNSGSQSLTEFKRRNGFQEMRFPKYYVPLTLKGRLTLKLGLLHGVRGLLPAPVVGALRKLRSRFYQRLRPQAAAA